MTRNIRKTRTPAPNSTYPKGGVSYFADSLVQAESSVLRMNFSDENPALRVAAKRYRQAYWTTQQPLNWQTIIETTGRHINLTADFLPTRQPNASYFIFFADPHFLKPILANRTSGTFGFVPINKADPSTKPKEPLLATTLQTNNSKSMLLLRILTDKLNSKDFI